MKRAKRPAGRRLTVVLVGVVASIAIAPVANSAADNVPRPPGAIDGRGYELVSQPDKASNQVGQGAQLSTDGTRILYNVVGNVPGSPGSARSQLLATRTSSGWTSKSILPATQDLLAGSYFEAFPSPDLGSVIATAFDGLGATDLSPDESIVRLTDNQQTLLHTFPVYFGASGAEVVASDDLSRVFVNAPEAIDPSHQAGTFNVYDIGSGTPRLVSRMPGTGLAPQCGVSDDAVHPGFARSVDSVANRWVSTDGTRAFFASAGDDAVDGCTAPLELYAADVTGATSTLVSGPPVSGDPDNGVDRFLQAAPDGSWVYYRTATSLVAADDADGNNSDVDIYRWDAATRTNECVTCGIPNADVSVDTGVAVSADGSHVYFASTDQYAGAPTPADPSNPNTYVWRASDDSIHFIARSNGVDPRPGSNGQVTHDGRFLFFASNSPDINAQSGSDNGGFTQYYRYDDGDGSITCVSCPAGTPGTADAPALLAVSNQAVPADIRIMSDDGSIVVFPSAQALVPQDVNNGPDIYEWHNGRVGLITNGTTVYAGRTSPLLMGISPDGRDILFSDFARLTSEAQDDASKVYDARVGGGFPPAPTAPAGCSGEQCHGLPSIPPALTDPGSVSLTGAGNVAAAIAGRLGVASPTRAQLERLARTGRLDVKVTVNLAGDVSVSAGARIGRRTRSVGHVQRHAGKGGTLTLTLRLSPAARAQLARAGRLTVVLDVRFSKVRASKRLVLHLRAPRGNASRAINATAADR